MSDADVDTDSCIFIVSDTDENSDGSDDDTDVDQKPTEDDETEIEEENVSVSNKVPKKSLQTKCKYCKLVLKRTSLRRHIRSVHKPTFVECPMSSCNRQIKTTQINYHLRRTHKLAKYQTNGHPSKIGTRKSTRVFTPNIKTENTGANASTAICENHQISCEVCNHQIILPKGIQLAHGQCNNNQAPKAKQNRQVARSTPRLTPRMVITKKEMQCCPACKDRFSNDRVAAEHYQKIHKRTVLACQFCDKYYSSSDKLKRHIDSFHA